MVTEMSYDKAELKKESDNYKSELQNWKDQCFASEKVRKKLGNEIHKLSLTIKEAYDEIEKLKKDYSNVINERDIVATQLIRRNDELALLYEKIKILQSKLARGEVQY
jgi:chromosome segregation ATPase